ncbi:MAG: hypothetical protein GKS00_13255 [Alphaproteobacteria bacterium]|nr:hypothetical protein [Alphaproteobacteria bacterium]
MANTFPGRPATALLVVVFLILLVRFIPFLDIHDPWIDEAMLLANFPLATISGLFEPLPYFEQGGALGYIALLNFVALSFPDQPVLPFRILSVIASLVGAGLILAAVRRLASGPVVVLALAFACLTPFIVRYSLEIKPYIFEYLATALVMHASTYLLSGTDVKRFSYFLGASIFAIVFSFTAPIAIGAFGIGVMAHRWFRDTGETRIKGMLYILAALSLTAVIFLVYYFGYTRPVTAIQFSAHAYIYDAYHLTYPPQTEDAIKRWFMLPYLFVFQLDLFPQHIYAKYQFIELKWIVYAAIALFFVAGVISAARISLFVVASFISAIFLIFGLSLIGLLPIGFVRHFTFMLPLTAIVAAFGVAVCFHWSFGWVTPKIAPACIILGLSAIGISGYHKASNLEREALSPLITHIVESDGFDTPVWVFYSAQPAMRILAPKSLVQTGLVDHKSSIAGWSSKQKNASRNAIGEQYYEQFAQSIRNYSEIWLVFSHMWLEPDLARFMVIAKQEVGGCREVMTAQDSHLWRCGQTQKQNIQSDKAQR